MAENISLLKSSPSSCTSSTLSISVSYAQYPVPAAINWLDLIVPAATGTASKDTPYIVDDGIDSFLGMIALRELSEDGDSAILAGMFYLRLGWCTKWWFGFTALPPGAFATVPEDTLVPSTPAPADNPRAPTYLCCACGVLNNPPPHEPNPYYAVTEGLAVSVIRGVWVPFLLVRPWKYLRIILSGLMSCPLRGRFKAPSSCAVLESMLRSQSSTRPLPRGNVKILPTWFGHIVVYLSVAYLYVA